MTPERIARHKAEQILRERLQSKTCGLWPYCDCHETLEKWAYDLSDEQRIWPMDLLEWGETTIFISLCCIAKYCPDKAIKVYAKRQLQDEFWDHQKALSVKGWQ
jgi:hypothetical protein